MQAIRRHKTPRVREVDRSRLRQAAFGLLVVGLLALAGLGAYGTAYGWAAANTEPPPEPTPVEDLYPSDRAAAFAEAFTIELLEVNEERPAEERAAALKAYIADGVDQTGGWDGKGFSTVQHVSTVTVDVHSETLAGVTVQARVAGAETTDTRWLNIPVYADPETGRLAVLGLPAIVQQPDPAEPPGFDVMDHDAALARDIYDTLLYPFLDAWAEGDRPVLRALTVDGADPVGLPDGWALVDAPIGSVTVEDESAGDTRRVTATATLRDPSGVQFKQDYEFRIRKVSDTRWAVLPPVTSPLPLTEGR